VRTSLLLCASIFGCTAGAPARELPRPRPTDPPIAAGECTRFTLPTLADEWTSAAPMRGYGDLCARGEDVLEEARQEARRAIAGPAPSITKPWYGKGDPRHLRRVRERLGLRDGELAALRTRGFVVLERHAFRSHTEAFHEIHQSELPLWVSADAIVHAIHRSNDAFVERLELATLQPRLARILEAMHCALGEANLPSPVARDLDLYLTVARALLSEARAQDDETDERPPTSLRSLFGNDAEAAALLARMKAAAGLEEIEIFGRPRVVDFSAYRPRGHYEGALAAYFRAVTFLSRFELNLVTYDCASSSKGDRAQTPREASIAIGLVALAAQAKVSTDLAEFERAWQILAGRREDLSLDELSSFGIAPDDPAAFAKLRSAIGQRTRTARTHFTWEGCRELPAITTVLGARIVLDAGVTRPLVHGEILDRQRLGIADVAYAFGLDRGRTWLASDLAEYPSLSAQLEVARKTVRDAPAGRDLHGARLAAIRAIAEPPAGALPSFMRGAAWDDARLSSFAGAFAQLRHDYVLVASGSYGEAGCTIPDAFVEPVPRVYGALAEYAERGAQASKILGADFEVGRFEQIGADLRLLEAIAERELAGKPLPLEALRFLAQVVEVTGGDRVTGSSPTFTGWHFDLFHRRDEALDGVSLLADYYTSTVLGEAAYAGVAGVELGVFVVDVGGPPRIVVGPVARTFEAHAPLPRLADADLSKVDRKAPWRASYVSSGPAAPPLALHGTIREVDQKTDAITIRAWSTRAIGPVTIELLDHHRRPVARITSPVGVGPTTFSFPARRRPGPDETKLRFQGVHVRVGDFDAWETGPFELERGAPPLLEVGEFSVAFGGLPKPPAAVVDHSPHFD
jgi:hypothetical protein